MSEERLKFATRFAEVAAQLGYEGHGKQTQLAKHYSKKQPSVKKWFDGDSQPDYEICVDMCKRGRVHFEWLMTGRGPKVYGPPPADTVAHSSEPAADQETLAVLEMMKATDPEGRILVKNAVIDALTQYKRRQDQFSSLTSSTATRQTTEFLNVGSKQSSSSS